jgi:putative ABC transport system ATP-binding protein
MRMYELIDVTRSYGEGDTQVRAVDRVTLAIPEGEFCVVAGPSGSGKTTLLQLLGGLDWPTAGEVRFEGRDLGRLADADLAALRLSTFGFVFQQFNLIPTLTAVQNVQAAIAPTGPSPARGHSRARAVLEVVGLGGRVDHLPSMLSGGEQQRVAIARALANEPRVILADEPTGNLDTRTGDGVLDLLVDLTRDRGLTIVLITHDQRIAETAPRVVRMSDGRVVEGAAPAGAPAPRATAAR